MLDAARAHPQAAARAALCPAARRRRDRWPDRQAAFDRYRETSFANFPDETLWDYVNEGCDDDATTGEVVLSFRAWEAAFYAHPPLDVWDEIPRLSLPTLAVRGAASDTLFPDAWALCRPYSPGCVPEMSGAGHMLTLEAPDDAAAVVLHRLEDQNLSGAGTKRRQQTRVRPTISRYLPKVPFNCLPTAASPASRAATRRLAALVRKRPSPAPSPAIHPPARKPRPWRSGKLRPLRRRPQQAEGGPSRRRAIVVDEDARVDRAATRKGDFVAAVAVHVAKGDAGGPGIGRPIVAEPLPRGEAGRRVVEDAGPFVKAGPACQTRSPRPGRRRYCQSHPVAKEPGPNPRRNAQQPKAGRRRDGDRHRGRHGR